MESPGALTEEIRKAKQWHAQGDYPQAMALYHEILATDSTHAEAKHFLGIALHQMKEAEKANALMRESLELQPDNVEWWNNYGNVLTEQKKLQEAEIAFTRVLALTPEDEMAWHNLGTVFQLQGLHDKAEEAYREALTINPRSIAGLKLMGNLLRQKNRLLEAAQLHAEAVTLDPNSRKNPLELARAWVTLNRVDKAAEVYAQWHRDEPDNPTAIFLQAACTGENVPESCSQAYVETTFDAYASTFDSVQKQLSYRGAEMLEKILAEIDLPRPPLDILDLGCGTGMCAPYLSPLARTLTGVDLSQKMLDRAAEGNAYTQLIKADILDYLNAHPAGFDLLTSAECFIYFGNLQKVFPAIVQALRPGGVCIFTIERLDDPEACYKLHEVGRYCHTQEYVMSLVVQNELEVIKIDPGILRMEMCLPVEGFIWAIRKRS